MSIRTLDLTILCPYLDLIKNHLLCIIPGLGHCSQMPGSWVGDFFFKYKSSSSIWKMLVQEIRMGQVRTGCLHFRETSGGILRDLGLIGLSDFLKVYLRE